MPATYEPIATTTLGSAASTITFSSIPNTYTDLRLVMILRADSGTPNGYVQFNGNTTTTNYYQTNLVGDGSAAYSNRGRGPTAGIYLSSWLNLNDTTPEMWTIDIMSYAGSTNKTSLLASARDRNGSGYVERSACLWLSTSAINQVSIVATGTNLASGCTATLYGILKA